MSTLTDILRPQILPDTPENIFKFKKLRCVPDRYSFEHFIPKEIGGRTYQVNLSVDTAIMTVLCQIGSEYYLLVHLFTDGDYLKKLQTVHAMILNEESKMR